MTAPEPTIQTRHNQNFIRKALIDVKAKIMIHDSTVVEIGRGERSEAMLITHNQAIQIPMTIHRCCHT